MDGSGARPSMLPLRPMTVGELLDASVALLGGYARPLFALGAVLALVEQMLLVPLRILLEPEGPLVGDTDFFTVTVPLVLGLGTESAILALLAAPAARAAGAALLGQRIPGRDLLAGADTPWAGAATVALIAGTAATVAATLCLLPWLPVYGLLGLAVPALVIERLTIGRALRRSGWLIGKSHLRALWIRLVGYVAWLLLRVALGVAGVYAFDWFGLPDSPVLMAVPWLLAGVVAYPALACLDATLYLETRMRVEGLDLVIGRMKRHGDGPRLVAEVTP